MNKLSWVLISIFVLGCHGSEVKNRKSEKSILNNHCNSLYANTNSRDLELNLEYIGQNKNRIVISINSVCKDGKASKYYRASLYEPTAVKDLKIPEIPSYKVSNFKITHEDNLTPKKVNLLHDNYYHIGPKLNYEMIFLEFTPSCFDTEFSTQKNSPNICFSNYHEFIFDKVSYRAIYSYDGELINYPPYRIDIFPGRTFYVIE